MADGGGGFRLVTKPLDETVAVPLSAQLKTFLTARESAGVYQNPGNEDDFKAIKVNLLNRAGLLYLFLESFPSGIAETLSFVVRS